MIEWLLSKGQGSEVVVVVAALGLGFVVDGARLKGWRDELGTRLGD